MNLRPSGYETECSYLISLLYILYFYHKMCMCKILCKFLTAILHDSPLLKGLSWVPCPMAGFWAIASLRYSLHKPLHTKVCRGWSGKHWGKAPGFPRYLSRPDCRAHRPTPRRHPSFASKCGLTALAQALNNAKHSANAAGSAASRATSPLSDR